MELDWLTVAAQIVNFLVLVWLLQHFLYAPITKAMARREERIKEGLAEARNSRTEAEAEAVRLREMQEDLERRKEAMMDEARQEVSELHEKLVDELRENLDEERIAWHNKLDEERAEFSDNFRKIASRQVIGTIRTILSDFADAELAAQVADEFVVRLDALTENELQKLKDAAARTKGDAIVESGIELPPAARSRITRAVHEKLNGDKELEYRMSEELVLGIRLILGEQTVEWSARRHLETLENVIEEALESDAVKSKMDETRQ